MFVSNNSAQCGRCKVQSLRFASVLLYASSGFWLCCVFSRVRALPACSRCEEQALDHCYCVHPLEVASQRCRQAPTLPELGGHKSAARNAEAAKAQQYASIDATKKTRGQ